MSRIARAKRIVLDLLEGEIKALHGCRRLEETISHPTRGSLIGELERLRFAFENDDLLIVETDSRDDP